MRVLIVDDHDAVRRQVRFMLSDAGCEVCGEAVDGEDAIAKTRELRPDLIVMDISMPKLNGLEATRQLQELFPDVEILMLSQTEIPAMIYEAFEAGAHGYVIKSEAATDLPAALEHIKKGRRFFYGKAFDHSPDPLVEAAALQSDPLQSAELPDEVLQAPATAAPPAAKSATGSGTAQ
jgi:DNA-binding NarL/FixJ family response regulator